jgi:dTDP-4-dehydrorhamnose reductase
MRILLLGGSGQLGTEIRRRWIEHDISAPSSSEVDVQNEDALIAAFNAVHFDAVINCTAFHHVDNCESVPERAFSINTIAVDRLARLCHKRDYTFMTISTDYVFDGEARTKNAQHRKPYIEEDIPHPMSTYGISKFAGELLVDRLQMKAFVVRTCGLYGTTISSSKGYTFIDRIISQALAREPLRIVNDIVSSPTFAGHLADALNALLATAAYGLYHAANEGAVSWHAFAVETLQQAGIDHDVEAISSAARNMPARRPAFSALSNEKINMLGIAMPSWKDGIRDYLAQRRPPESQ